MEDAFVEVLRLNDDGDTTVGVWRIGEKTLCGNIEDQGRPSGEKVIHETRIPEGLLKIGLRSEGGYHNRYLKKYGEDFHKGMLCIYNAPDWKIILDGKEFQFILVHTGNTDDHTSGCLLPNFSIDFANSIGGRSADAYEMLYPILRDAILESEEGFVYIRIRDINKG